MLNCASLVVPASASCARSPCSAVMADADAEEEHHLSSEEPTCFHSSMFSVPMLRLEPMEVGGLGPGGILLHADFPRVVICGDLSGSLASCSYKLAQLGLWSFLQIYTAWCASSGWLQGCVYLLAIPLCLSSTAHNAQWTKFLSYSLLRFLKNQSCIIN